MNLGTDRIIFSRDLSEEEYISLSIFMVGFIQNHGEEDLYFYVDINDNFDLSVSTYEAEEVQWQAAQLMCTDQEAVISMTEYDGYYEEIMELLWKNDINNYDRYIAQTIETIGEGIDPRWCVASDEKEAFHYFSNILKVKDIVTIRVDNEETF